MSPMPTGRELFDRVSDIIIEQFNSCGVRYGTRARHSYPVKREDVFDEPMVGGAADPPCDCRALIAYVLANHIPVWDDFAQTSRLPTDKFTAAYLGRCRQVANRMIGRGCRMVADPRFRKAYVGSMLRIASEGITTWNVGKAVRTGDCK